MHFRFYFHRSFFQNPNALVSGTDPISDQPDYILPFQYKLPVFQALFKQFQTTFTSQMDDHVYLSFGLMVAISQQTHGDVIFTPNLNISSPCNIYKDSNIKEVIGCIDLLKIIRGRTCQELEQWPDHATLVDINRVLDKILSLPSNSPIVRFSAGMQILRQKLDEWNQVAHRNNNLRTEEGQVADIIQKWTKMELQFWRECLNEKFETVQQRANKYWFFIYNIIHEYFGQTLPSNSLNVDRLKQMFGNTPSESLEEHKTGHLKSTDIINIIKQFVENSNYADFGVRMRIIKSFEVYLQFLNQYQKNDHRYEKLSAIFYNILQFYEQFRFEIDHHNKQIRAPIEKKLKEFVKIESYNKDLSYFSMKNNIMHVHRNLHRFLKEYEELITVKITSVLSYKSNLLKELNEDQEDKRQRLQYEAKHDYCLIEVNNFVASSKLKVSLEMLNRNCNFLISRI